MAVDHTENMDQSSQANLTIQIQQADKKNKMLRRLIKENLEEVSCISISLNAEKETTNDSIEAMATNSCQLSNYLAPLLDMPQPEVSPNAFKQVLELFLSTHSQDRLRLILLSPCDRWYLECLLTTGHSNFKPVLIEYQMENEQQSPRDFFKHLIPFFERAPIESAKDSNQISVEFNGQSFCSLYTTTTPIFNTHRLQSYMNAENNNNQMWFYNQKTQHLPAKPYGSLLNRSISTEQDGILTTKSLQQIMVFDLIGCYHFISWVAQTDEEIYERLSLLIAIN
eukprot:403350971